ncbi:MAG: SLBB domain-containing protein [Ruthenibacterium sp.]
MELQTLRTLLQNSGVVGAGGAGFPTYRKLNEKADTILLNCAECEPLLKLHQQLLETHTPEILHTLDSVAKLLGAKQVFVCAKSEYKRTTQALHECLPAFPEMRLELLDSIYPTGDEVILIYEVTGRVVRPGGLPIEAGVVVFNVETMYNIYRATEQGVPVTDKLVTVTGAVQHPITVRVPIGTAVEDLVTMAGGATISDPAFLIGGPMMGNLGSAKQPVTKTTNAVLVLPQEQQLVLNRTSNASIQLKRAASACCQCESCTDMCPRHLLGHPIQPHLFMRAAANNDFRDANVFLNTMYCSGCGVCELYACPQSLSPRTLITNYKNGLRAAGVPVPQDTQSDSVVYMRAFHTVPEKRLQARVGLTKYESDAPLDDTLRRVKRVKILFSQHIGAPAKPVVEMGAEVRCGDLLAKPAEGLSVAIHASVTGKVIELNDKFAILESSEAAE